MLIRQMLIRDVTAADRTQWDQLYQGYAEYYQVDTDTERRDRLFGWLLDARHVCEGLVAEDAGKLLGLAHFRAMPSPLRGSEVGFLDDLFVDPDARGSGAAEAMIRALDDIAERRDWPVVRWITREDNYRARGLYDRCALRSNWVTYEMNASTIGRP